MNGGTSMRQGNEPTKPAKFKIQAMIHYTCPMLFPALSLPFLIGGRDGTTPVFTVVSIHPHKVLLQHLQQSIL